jgi:protoheme ferro-lyase
MKPGGLLQPLSIPDWKWEDIIMGFIMDLLPTGRKVDSIWVIIDHFTKSAHFIPVHTRFIAEKYVKIYIARILCLHGVPKMIVSNRGSKFVARFWEQLHASLGTQPITRR